MSESLQQTPSSLNLDLSYLEDIAGGSNDFIIEMIDMFLEQTPGYFDEIKQAIADGNWKTVSDLAHKVKPTLAFMGSNESKEIMAKIEMDTRNLENLDEVEPIFNELHSFCLQLFAELKIARDNLPRD